MIKKLILFSLILTSYSCKKDDVIVTSDSNARLLFSSGFEKGIYLSNPTGDYETMNWPDYKVLRGTDSITGFSWPINILGSEFSGIHYIETDEGAAVDNYLENVIGHTGAMTTALFQRVDYSIGATQIPYQINKVTQNPDELYIRYWMKIENSSMTGINQWRAIWEYKTVDYQRGDGFRMIAFIYTNSSGIPYWSFQGDTSPSTPVWEEKNFTVPVPREEWFKVEYYLKWSEGADGRALMMVNGKVVGEHNGPTTANSKDLDFIMLTQIYGNTHPMHQWIDDIEIWDGIPSE